MSPETVTPSASPSIVMRAWRRLCPIVEQGGRPRWGFAPAYHCTDRSATVCAPLGLALVLGIGKRIVDAVRLGLTPSAIDRLRHEAMQLGVSAGVRATLDAHAAELARRFHREKVVGADPETLKAALVAETLAVVEHETLAKEDQQLLAATAMLSERLGVALALFCRDPRCADQPQLEHIDGTGGYWLACPHKRRWLWTPVGRPAKISTRALGRLGLR